MDEMIRPTENLLTQCGWYMFMYNPQGAEEAFDCTTDPFIMMRMKHFQHALGVDTEQYEYELLLLLYLCYDYICITISQKYNTRMLFRR